MTPSGTTSEQVTFRHTFTLPGLEGPHRPGTFEVRTAREALDVSWPAFRLTVSIVLTEGGMFEVLDVKRGDLDAALARDVGRAAG